MNRQARAAIDIGFSGVVLAGATASGALLWAVAEGGYADFHDLVWGYGLAGAVAVVAAALLSWPLAGSRLARAVLVGAAAGVLGTAAMEAVREIGFRVFHAMPGDMPMLMGVFLNQRIMLGPNTASNIAGWADHAWNGAMFGVIYAVLVGGFPRRHGVAWGAGMGVVYGLVLGTGFLLSPVPTALGVGKFGSDFGPRFAVTVYLAHVAFGVVLGPLVSLLARRVAPIWSVAASLLPTRTAVPDGLPATART